MTDPYIVSIVINNILKQYSDFSRQLQAASPKIKNEILKLLISEDIDKEYDKFYQLVLKSPAQTFIKRIHSEANEQYKSAQQSFKRQQKTYVSQGAAAKSKRSKSSNNSKPAVSGKGESPLSTGYSLNKNFRGREEIFNEAEELREEIAEQGYRITKRKANIAREGDVQIKNNTSWKNANKYRISLKELEVNKNRLRKKMAASLQHRYVNILFASDQTGKEIAGNSTLNSQKTYYLKVNIGELHHNSIVEHAQEHPYPAHLLPKTKAETYRLNINVFSDDFKVTANTYHLALPKTGSSWACFCQPEAEDVCECKNHPEYLYIPVRPKMSTGIGFIRLNTYYRNNLLQSHLISVELATVEKKSTYQKAVVDFTLSHNLNELAKHSSKDLNIMVNQNSNGEHKVMFKGNGEDSFDFNFDDTEGRNCLETIQEALLHIMFDVRKNGKKIPRSKVGFPEDKDFDDFRKDLKILASEGHTLWSTVSDYEKNRLRFRAGVLKNPATIQICVSQNRNFHFPWAFIYDIPLGPKEETYTYCKILMDWEKKVKEGDEITDTFCPHEHEEDHQENVICPFGFWGFKHRIEQTISDEQKGLTLKIRGHAKPEIIVGYSTDENIGKKITDNHLDEIASKFYKNNFKKIDTSDTLKKELGKDLDLELLYFYCHGKRVYRDQKRKKGQKSAYLEIGHGDVIATNDIDQWKSKWPPNHWKITQPLVFINGCSTVDIGPDSIGNLATRFIIEWGASGVIGTETTISPYWAVPAGEVFFERFVKEKDTIGDSVKQLRLNLLYRGWLIGLGYTAYASSELKIIP